MEGLENPGSVKSVSNQQSEASRIVVDAEKCSHFLQVLKASEKIEGKDGYAICKIIRDENRPEGFKNISDDVFLEKAKFILKHNIHKKDPFCSVCLKMFKNSKDKINHVKLLHEKSEEKKFACQLCSKSFMSQTSYDYHLDVSHKLGDSGIKCKVCEKTFQHSVTLKRHMTLSILIIQKFTHALFAIKRLRETTI